MRAGLRNPLSLPLVRFQIGRSEAHNLYEGKGKGDILVVWKLDRLGRNLAHLVHTVQDLSARGVGLRVLAGQGAQIDTTTAPGRLVFGIFAALAEFERELIRERTLAGLKAAMAHRDTSVSELCTQLGIKPVTLYRYVGPQGQKVLAS